MEGHNGLIVPAVELDTTPPRWIVKDVVPETGVGVWWAESYTGKTVAALGMSMAICNGTPFLGHETTEGTVAYMLGEGLYDFGLRIEALVRSSLDKPEPLSEARLAVGKKQFRLTETQSLDGLIAFLDDYDDLRMVVFDTMSRFAGEDSLEFPTPARKVMMAASRIAEELGVFVMFIHHPTATGKKMRGAQLIFDMADLVIHQEKESLACDKLKCAKPFTPMPYTIQGGTWIDPETGSLCEAPYLQGTIPAHLERAYIEAKVQQKAAVRKAQAAFEAFCQRHPEYTPEELLEKCGDVVEPEMAKMLLHGQRAMEAHGAHRRRNGLREGGGTATVTPIRKTG